MSVQGVHLFHGKAGKTFEELTDAHLGAALASGAGSFNHAAWTAPVLPAHGPTDAGYGHEVSSIGIQELVNKRLVCGNAADTPA